MKPTPSLQRAIRRLPLTTKQGPHNYYKGNQTGSMGRHTKWGGYIIDWKKVRTYVCPDLSDFRLTPFVAKGLKSKPNRFTPSSTAAAVDGKVYLQRWKEAGGVN